MEEVLKHILCGQISVSDIKNWLKLDDSDIDQLRSVKNYEFVPFFINYLKEECSWALSKGDKSNENPIVEKKKTVTQLKQKETLQTIEKENSLKSKNFVPRDKANRSPLEDVNLLKESTIVSAKNRQYSNSPTHHVIGFNNIKTNIIENSNDKSKKVQVLTLGCSPYQPKRRETKKQRDSPRTLQNTTSNFNVTNTDVLFKKQKDNFASFNNLASNLNIKGTDAFPPLGSGVDLNSADAFPPLGGKTDDRKVRRRITPTPVQTANSGSALFSKSRFIQASQGVHSAFQSSVFLNEESSLQHERELLKQTREVIKPSLSTENPKEVLNVDAKTSLNKISDTFIVPTPENVSSQEQLEILSDIYSVFFDSALILNITSELFFLFELITLKVPSNSKEPKSKIFISIHNCVSFAVSVLNQQSHLLHMLDNATLASLLEIPYLIHFSPQLVEFLQVCLCSRPDVSACLPTLTRVPFQLDVDSRSSFPDESSFISFKKQRDLFYELLREWQDRRFDETDFKSKERFASKAKNLISLGHSSINMHHLAKLFQSQLIASCMCSEVNEVYDELLNDVHKQFPEKLKKLQERFLAPTQVGGLVPTPSFYGNQSFFSELIVAASSPSLNQHLINIFVCKILELNNTDVFADEELSSLGTVKDKFIFLLHTLRLLGKFLGYINFLPYKTEKELPSPIAEHYFKCRAQMAPPLNLAAILNRAVKKNRIILTVPWVVEYLSMADYSALRLEHVKEALVILMTIGRGDCFSNKNAQSALLLRLIIGWLFELLQFPKKYYQLLHPMILEPGEKTENGLDSLAVVDKQLIHSCCPYLIEFKVLVYNFLNNIKNKREVRKITPFSTTTQNELSSATSKHLLEKEIEEHFFSLHPSSLKKTVDFVAERMASKMISKIRQIVTNCKLDIVKNITETNEYKTIYTSNDVLHIKQQRVLKLLDPTITTAYKDVRNKVLDWMAHMKEDIPNIMSALVSDDTKSAVADICCQISFRLAANKITEWCDSNLLLEAMKSDIKSKVQHLFKGESSATCQNVNTSSLICHLRQLAVKMYSKSSDVFTENVFSFCPEIERTLSEDVPNSVRKTIIELIVDIYLALITNYPDKCDKPIQSLKSLWPIFSKDCPKVVPEKLIVCSQNFKFLSTAENFELSFQLYLQLIQYLLDLQVLNTKITSECIEDLNKLNWEDEMFKNALDKLRTIL